MFGLSVSVSIAFPFLVGFHCRFAFCKREGMCTIAMVLSVKELAEGAPRAARRCSLGRYPGASPSRSPPPPTRPCGEAASGSCFRLTCFFCTNRCSCVFLHPFSRGGYHAIHTLCSAQQNALGKLSRIGSQRPSSLFSGCRGPHWAGGLSSSMTNQVVSRGLKRQKRIRLKPCA